MVHQYKLNNYNIVLDTCSGAVHSVDPIAYDIIAMFQDKSEEEIVSEIMAKYGNLGNPAEVENPSEAENPAEVGLEGGTESKPDTEIVTSEEILECIEDIKELKAAGKLFTPDTFAELSGTFKERSGNVVKALCLHVAHTCNLNCSYCFASQGKIQETAPS